MSRRILVAATQELAEESSKTLEQYYPQVHPQGHHQQSPAIITAT